jgi:hypothetical protein
MAIVDVSDPDVPVTVGNWDPNDTNIMNTARSVYVSGKYAYVGGENSSNMAIVDIGGIETPNLQAGTINTDTLHVDDNAVFGNDLSIQNGLTVGSGGILSQSGISATIDSTATDSALTLTVANSTNTSSALDINHNGLGLALDIDTTMDNNVVDITANYKTGAYTSDVLTLQTNEENTGTFNFLKLISDADGTPSAELTIDQDGNFTIPGSGTFSITDGTDTLTINTTDSSLVFTDGSNSFTFDVDAGTTLAGNARPTRKVTLSPEYAGSSLTGDGVSNTGTMTSDFCENGVSADIPQTNTGVCNTSSDVHNYYSWTTGEGSAQDYDVWIRWRVPDNFAGWATADPMQVYAKATDATNNEVRVFVYDTTGALENASGTVVDGDGSWAQTSVETDFDLTYTAGSYITIRIVLTADTGGDSVQVGEIDMDYLTNN